MLIKFTDIFNKIIINLPDTEFWELRYDEFDDEGNYEGNMYLIYKDKKIKISDEELYTDKSSNLPLEEVGFLFEDVIEAIYAKINSDSELKIIDINVIEEELMEKKYFQRWRDRGYIDVDENGIW